MDIRKLQRAIVDGLEDVKAQNIVVFDTEALSPLFERVIVASGQSNRQTKALASSVRDVVKERGFQVMRTEGEDNGEWIIVDCGAAVVHVMQPAIREYYRLEEIWGEKPVKLKLLGTNARKISASPSLEEEPEEEVAPKKRAAKKTVAKKVAAKKASPSRTVASKTTASKPVAAKSSTDKPAAKKRSAPAAKKAATSRAAPVKAAPPSKSSTAAKKAAPRKTPARKTV